MIHGRAHFSKATLSTTICPFDGTVVVTDEVGLGVHPPTELGRRFRDDLGRLNTAVSEVADEVLLVMAGRILPLELLD